MMTNEIKSLDRITKEEKEQYNKILTRTKNIGSEMQTRRLTSPAERRDEIVVAKSQIRDYQQAKANKAFLKRRGKLIKSGWRNGIVGMESPDDAEGSLLFQSNRDRILSYQSRQDARKECKSLLAC